MVFLVALPLCLGISVASGFPPVAGLLTAIVGGVLVSLIGSARLTIKGPAAGLIVIAIGAVQDLGQGDMAVGYRRALAVGVLAALIQIVLSLCRTATVGLAIPPSVVHGMLAAIGVIIIAKQLHVVLGVKPAGESTFALIGELPNSLVQANPLVLVIGASALLILFGLPLIRARWNNLLPAPLLVLVVAVPLGIAMNLGRPHDYAMFGSLHHLGPETLVSLPSSLLDAVTLPDFSHILSPTSLQYTAMFALIGTIESTLTVLAVDSIDPRKQTSDLNRDLFATGTGNLVSALIGGLPMISEIVRSKANIDAGAASRWSNFSHGAFLLLLVALLPGVVQTFPMAALAAMLVYTGFRLASPSEFRTAWRLGADQFALFMVTLLVTLASDLLVGVVTGLALKVLLHLVRRVPVSALLRPRVETVVEGTALRVRVRRAAVFPALLKVRTALHARGPEITEVVVDVRDVVLLDHTFLSRIEDMGHELSGVTLTFDGLDDLKPVAGHPRSLRRRYRS